MLPNWDSFNKKDIRFIEMYRELHDGIRNNFSPHINTVNFAENFRLNLLQNQNKNKKRKKILKRSTQHSFKPNQQKNSQNVLDPKQGKKE